MLRAFLFTIFLFATGAGATELNSSIYIFHHGEIENCEASIDRSKSWGNSIAHFVFTFGYRGNIRENSVDHFCFGGHDCRSFTHESTARVAEGLKRCFKYAFSQGMDITLLSHVDYAGKDGEHWRNQIVFDPLNDYGGTSYYKNHLKPIADFLAEIIPSGRRFSWTIAGEMGATVFHHARSYREILSEFRKQLRGHQVNLGIGLNHVHVGGTAFHYTREQLAELEGLLHDSDYLGISAYRPHKIHELGPDSFYDNITGVKAELQSYGITLQEGKNIHFSEVAVGGAYDEGHTGSDYIAAQEPWQIIDSPWAGYGGPYNLAIDPWQRADFRNIRKKFYQSLLGLLSHQKGRSHPITEAFMWNLSSWDVQGFNSPEYGDPEIRELIRHHNENN